MPSDCPDCTAAAAGTHWEFSADCRGCCARSIARSPQFFEARKAGDKHDRKYRALLEQIGGLCKPPVTHNEVSQAAASDAALRQKVAA
jgi:hypothetical protein